MRDLLRMALESACSRFHSMTAHVRSALIRVSVLRQAVLFGLVIALVAANVWPILLVRLGAPLASITEAAFLALYVWWCGGDGPPSATRASRATWFRRGALSRRQWAWGLIAAVFVAVTVHAAIVLLFRLVPYPTAEFRRGYDFSFIPTVSLRWLAVVVSALSAAICEETGFRGYMQRPMEQRHGATVAILISSLMFTAVHLTKDWALAGMVPIVFGAGVLLGLLAWSSESLIPGMVGHFVMDVGLFAYWWTGIAGDFKALPIRQTGLDRSFVITCVTFAVSLSIVLLGIAKLRRISANR
jgi:membrane protease YdiL (CAAX protease family)